MRPLEEFEPAGPQRSLPARAHFAGLAFTEFWERFALAGVKSMLTLLLIDQVLQPGSDAQGAAWLRDQLASGGEGEGGTIALASYVYGAANALVYLSIPLGGLAGDLLAGRRASVIAGGTSMVAGLLLMISRQGFLPGLCLFAMGAGLLKGNLSAQFGALFADEARRTRAYSYYLVFLNAGVIFGPLAMGAAARAASWQAALALAAGGVVAGLGIYWRLIARANRPRARRTPRRPIERSPLGEATDPFALLRLILALLAVYLCFAAYGQITNIFLVWAERRVDLDFGGWPLPVGWLIALDGLITILTIFGLQAVLTLARRRGVRFGSLAQIVLGCLACAAAYAVLALAERVAGATISPWWVLAYLLLVDLAVALVWPSGLSLATGLAPGGNSGLWGGIFYLHGFFASLWVGFAGGLFGGLGAQSFWMLHAGVALAGAALALVATLLGPAMRVQAITTSA